MAEEEPKHQGVPPEAATDIEMEITYSGAAVLSNRFYVSILSSGVRIAFAEQYAPDKTPHFRTAVTMGFHDAIAFSKLMQQQLKEIEESIERLVVERAEKANG